MDGILKLKKACSKKFFELNPIESNRIDWIFVIIIPNVLPLPRPGDSMLLVNFPDRYVHSKDPGIDRKID